LLRRRCHRTGWREDLNLPDQGSVQIRLMSI
jgi:hypothetical protein